MLVRLSQAKPDVAAHQRCGNPEQQAEYVPSITSEMAAPTKSAAEKYARVRAVPRWRNARTNITRLRP